MERDDVPIYGVGTSGTAAAIARLGSNTILVVEEKWLDGGG